MGLVRFGREGARRTTERRRGFAHFVVLCYACHGCTNCYFQTCFKLKPVPAEEEMFHTFNMGIGMVVVVAKEDADRAVKCLPQARVIGEVVKGDAVQIV